MFRLSSVVVNYDFSARLQRDWHNQYIVTITEISNNMGILRIPFVLDTGATYTLLNKSLAESRGWKIFQTGIELGSYEINGAVMVCDLRKIPKVAFGVRQVSDLVVATPASDSDEVMNLLGRSFIDIFQFGVDQDKERVFFKTRNVAVDPNVSFSHMAHSSVVSGQ